MEEHQAPQGPPKEATMPTDTVRKAEEALIHGHRINAGGSRGGPTAQTAATLGPLHNSPDTPTGV
jgi:hypothetical protein